ncbi:MAG: hypothetical protein LHW49_02015 [Candidatus Cloacimonetes bacterium]|nr:hypothetical protein [Candidatus Cloacimonadota bacterium]
MCKKFVLFWLFLALIFGVLYAQNRTQDAFDELEFGELNLYFFNAINGEPIVNATVTLDGIGQFLTDKYGRISFEPLEDNYMQEVSFRSSGYINSVFDIEIRVGTIFFNRYSISPVMDINYFRVVLDWGKSPRDLDAHFEKKGQYHISYRNTKVLADGRGQLDRDETNGYGPETITVTHVKQDAQYEYFVHDYTNRNNRNSTNLSKSKATVKVYGNNQLLKVYQVPEKQKGSRWSVFRIENGEIVGINQVE